ncbi:MAG: GNAT family protein [Pseudomonadota bacterium]
MDPVPLHSERLVLRCAEAADQDRLVAALNDQRVSQWLARVPFPYGPHDAIRWVSISQDNWQRDSAYPFVALCGGDLIGGIGITRVSEDTGILGYWLVPERWRQGFGREMMHSVLRFGFDTCHFKRFEAGIHPDNARSGGLLLACGFHAIGDQIYLHPPRDGRLQGPHFRLNRDDYRPPPTRPSATAKDEDR